MSRSLPSLGLQPARLLCPWDSPGKNIVVGCHALLHGIFLSDSVSPGGVGGGAHLGNPRTKPPTVQRLLLSELSGSVALNLSLSPNAGELDCSLSPLGDPGNQTERAPQLVKSTSSVYHLRNHPPLFHHPSLPRHTPTSVSLTRGFAGEFLGLGGRQNSRRLLGQGL